MKLTEPNILSNTERTKTTFRWKARKNMQQKESAGKQVTDEKRGRTCHQSRCKEVNGGEYKKILPHPPEKSSPNLLTVRI